MDDVTVPLARKLDYAEMVALVLGQHAEDDQDAATDEVRAILHHLEQRETSSVVVVAVDEYDEVVGYRFRERFCGNVFADGGFLVRDDCRGRGIGGAISELMFAELRRRGFRLAVTGNSAFYASLKGAVVDGRCRRPTELYLRQGYRLVVSTEQTNLFVRSCRSCSMAPRSL